MRFERQEDRDRETKAIEAFCNKYDLTYEKLGKHDVDFKVFDKEGNFKGFVEVKGRMRTLDKAYPLPISARKLVKLSDRGDSPIIIWALFDGIIYSKVEKLYGVIKFGGRRPREGSSNDLEVMAYFNENHNFHTIKY